MKFAIDEEDGDDRWVPGKPQPQSMAAVVAVAGPRARFRAPSSSSDDSTGSSDEEEDEEEREDEEEVAARLASLRLSGKTRQGESRAWSYEGIKWFKD